MSKRRKIRPRPVPILSARGRYRKYRQWLRWFSEIKHAVFDLAHKRYIYREITKIIEANPRLHVPSAFYDWMRRVYITDMTLSIRRLVDWDRRTIAFVRLMQEIEDHPEVITRQRFVYKYKGWLRKHGHRDFEKFARPGKDVIDRRIIRSHRRELINSQKRLREYVNRYIAHSSKFKLRRLPTHTELDACVDTLETLVKSYTLLLEQGGLIEVVPQIQYDWKAPFRIPWIEKAEDTE